MHAARRSAKEQFRAAALQIAAVHQILQGLREETRCPFPEVRRNVHNRGPRQRVHTCTPIWGQSPLRRSQRSGTGRGSGLSGRQRDLIAASRRPRGLRAGTVVARATEKRTQATTARAQSAAETTKHISTMLPQLLPQVLSSQVPHEPSCCPTRAIGGAERTCEHWPLALWQCARCRS